MRTELSVTCAIAIGLLLFAGCAPVDSSRSPEPAQTAFGPSPTATEAPTASIPSVTPPAGVLSGAPSLRTSLDQLASESTDIFTGTVVRLLDERVNIARGGKHGVLPGSTAEFLNRQYEVQIERSLKGEASTNVILIMEREKTRFLWQRPGQPDLWQEAVPQVAPVPPTIGQRYLFFARPWGWGVFSGKLLAYGHPSRFALQGGMATVEDEYFVRATKDKYYPPKPEAEFLAEVQAAIARNPTNIPDLVGSQ